MPLFKGSKKSCVMQGTVQEPEKSDIDWTMTVLLHHLSLPADLMRHSTLRQRWAQQVLLSPRQACPTWIQSPQCNRRAPEKPLALVNHTLKERRSCSSGESDLLPLLIHEWQLLQTLASCPLSSLCPPCYSDELMKPKGFRGFDRGQSPIQGD